MVNVAMPDGCPAPEDLDALLNDELARERGEQIQAHVDDCAACRLALGALAQTIDDRAPQTRRVVRVRVERIDRYRVIRTLGRGGMGVVLLAEDDELQRKLAIKLMRPDLVHVQDRQRLLREAQAMAQVSHPNVVAIFDVGIHNDQVFIAMEYVEGTDLAHWMRGHHSLREVLDVFSAAGRGLAAAHRAGIIHRDFKPHNVLLGTHGEVKVTDFGLARAELAATPPARASVERLLDTPITRVGAVVGTPQYMAPEQLLGEPVDARADQFSFCVGLYEALCGERPFQGSDTAELSRAALTAAYPEQPLRRVPARVRAVVRRGLSPEPDRRFASMDELIVALVPPRARKRLVVAGLVATALAGGTMVVAVGMRAPGGATCDGGPSELASVWNVERRLAIQRAFMGAGGRDAKALIAALDAYANAWQREHRDACEDTRLRGDQSEQLLDLRMACLRRRRIELGALVDELAAADEAVTRRGPAVVTTLASPVACSDVKREPTTAAPAAMHWEEEAIEADLAKVQVKLGLLRIAGVLEQLEGLRARAERAGHKPLIAQTEYWLGVHMAALQDSQRAVAHYKRAAEIADEAGADDVRVLALVALMNMTSRDGKLDDAARWSDIARGAVKRVHSLEVLAQFDMALAELAAARGNVTEAIADYDRASERYARAFGATSVQVANVQMSMGSLYVLRNEHDRGIDHLRQAYEVMRNAYPDTLFGEQLLVTMAIARIQQGTYAEAQKLAAQALAELERVGGDDEQRAQVFALQALALQGLGKRDEAFAKMKEVLERTANAPPADMLPLIALFHYEGARYDAAYAILARTLEHEESKGPDRVQVATILGGLGSLRSKQRKFAEAAELLSRARTIIERLQPESNGLAEMLTKLGALETKRGAAKQAVPLLEQALALRAARGASTWDTSLTELELAIALWAEGRDRARAIAMARDALAHAEAAKNRKTADDARSWLAANAH